MENELMTKAELADKVSQFMKKAKVKDHKWIYNYFTGHDEFPIVTDEHKLQGVPGEGTAEMGHHLY